MFLLLLAFACQKPVPTQAIYPEIRFNAVEIPEPVVSEEKKDLVANPQLIADLERRLTAFSELTYGKDDQLNGQKIRVEKWQELKTITLPDFDITTLRGKYTDYTAVVALGAIAELRWVEMALRYPIPPSLSRFEQMIFQEELIHFVEEMRLGAKSKLEMLINIELESGRRGRFPLMALKELQRLEPLEYPTPEQVSGTLMDGLSQWLQLQDRSVFQPVVIWPDKREYRANLTRSFSNLPDQKKKWTQSCRALLNDLIHLGPGAFDYCIGRNAAASALSVELSDDQHLNAVKAAYWVIVDQSLSRLSEGGFWHRQLLTEVSAFKRRAATHRRVNGESMPPDIHDADPFWTTKPLASISSPSILLHRQMHGMRIHYRMERFIKKLRRLSVNPAEARRSLKREYIEVLEKYERDAKRVLSLYPESRELRDQFLFSLGSANLKYADALMDHARLFSDDASGFLFDRIAERQLHGHRLLLLCRDRSGERSKWSEKADVELRFYFPNE